jgi:hypothetical protein
MRGRRRPGQFKRGKLRRMRSRYQSYLMEGAFADVEQGIVVRHNGRLILNPAKERS